MLLHRMLTDVWLNILFNVQFKVFSTALFCLHYLCQRISKIHNWYYRFACIFCIMQALTFLLYLTVVYHKIFNNEHLTTSIQYVM